MEKRERFKNIDFLRFVGAIAIVFFHLVIIKSGICEPFLKQVPLYVSIKSNAINCGRWVDFFFVISGFFMFMYTDFSRKFIDFFKKKIIRLLPVILFAILLYMILSWFDLLVYEKYINIFTMLLLNNVGFTSKNTMGAIHPVWFVSALFWASMFYFYLKNLVNEKWFNFITVLLIFFSCSYLANTTTFAKAVYCNFINIGLLRAIGELGIGYLISLVYKEYKKIKVQNENVFKTIVFTAAETYLLVFIIQNTMFHKIHFNNYLIFVIAFVALFWLFLIKRGYITRFLDNNLSVILGRYSYSIFVMHIIVQDLLRRNFWDIHRSFVIAHPVFNLILPVILAILLGVVTYHLVERPAARYLKNKWFPDKGKKPETLENTTIQPVEGGN